MKSKGNYNKAKPDSNQTSQRHLAKKMLDYGSPPKCSHLYLALEVCSEPLATPREYHSVPKHNKSQQCSYYNNQQTLVQQYSRKHLSQWHGHQWSFSWHLPWEVHWWQTELLLSLFELVGLNVSLCLVQLALALRYLIPTQASQQLTILHGWS